MVWVEDKDAVVGRVAVLAVVLVAGQGAWEAPRPPGRAVIASAQAAATRCPTRRVSRAIR